MLPIRSVESVAPRIETARPPQTLPGGYLQAVPTRRREIPCPRSRQQRQEYGARWPRPKLRTWGLRVKRGRRYHAPRFDNGSILVRGQVESRAPVDFSQLHSHLISVRGNHRCSLLLLLHTGCADTLAGLRAVMLFAPDQHIEERGLSPAVPHCLLNIQTLSLARESLPELG